MEYADLVAEGKNINIESAKDQEAKQNIKNAEEMAHAEETPNVVEYSMSLAGNALEKENTKKQDEAEENQEDDENLQIAESEAETAPETKWYENDKKAEKIDFEKLNKTQKLELSHKAMIQGQKDLETGKADADGEDGKKEQTSDKTDDIEMTTEQLINLKSRTSIEKSQWPQDMETTEINTDAWDSNRLADGNADSPFQTIKYSSDAKLTKEQIADKNTDEIVNLYNTKYEKSNNSSLAQKPSFFEELWAKQHPEEKALIQEEEDKEKKLDDENKASEEQESEHVKSASKYNITSNSTVSEPKIAENKTKAENKTVTAKNQSLAQQNEKTDNQAPFLTETHGETRFDNSPAYNKYGSANNDGDKAPLTAEEEYQKLISDAKKEDPWKEPIKDLIDQYADLAEKNEKSATAKSEKE